MAITMNDLTVNFSHLDRETLLENWRWLIGETKQPILLSALGNAFVQNQIDGSVEMLDIGAGRLLAVADSAEEFTDLLNDKDFVATAFDVQAFGDLRMAGMVLQSGQIFSFKVPLAMGGKFALANIEVTDISVHFSVAGQLFEKINNLPEGAQVTNVSISS